MYITIDQPILTHDNHLKTIVYIRIHSWCCTFYQFRKMYNDMYAWLWYHTEYLPCPKNLLCSANSSLPTPHPLATTDICTVSTVLFSPECHIVDIIQYVDFSD